LTRHGGVASMGAFIAVFLIATFAISQLLSLIPRALQGALPTTDALIGTGYLAVVVVSIVVLGRLIYASELAAGRVKRRVKLFE